MREWIALGLQVVGVVAVIVGIGLWLGVEAAMIVGGVAGLVAGTLLEMTTGEVATDGEGAGEAG